MASGTGKRAKGVVRFKTGFPPKIREYIRKNLGTNWHLELSIKDGDDGDGDDGDPGPSPFAAKKGAPAAKASGGAKKLVKPAANRGKSRPQR